MWESILVYLFWANSLAFDARFYEETCAKAERKRKRARVYFMVIVATTFAGEMTINFWLPPAFTKHFRRCYPRASAMSN